MVHGVGRLRLMLLLCIIVLGAGCTGTPVPATPPVSPAPPAAPVAAPATATAAVLPEPDVRTGPTTFTSPRYGYTVALPCCWVALPVPTAAAAAALDDLQQNSGASLPGTLAAGLPAEALELVALLPNAESGGAPVAQLTVSVLPSEGLSLSQYLAATAAELGAITNTGVESARIDTTLHPDQLPAAVIEYRTRAQTPLAGLQVSFYLEDPTYLLVLTFTSAAASYPEQVSSFSGIVRGVTLAEPS